MIMPGQRQISAFRDELKGIAILWIVFYHARLGLGGPVGGFQSLGYAGVDIFFFLTGFGLYHSLEKSQDLKRYCSRRLWRILPAYLPLCAVWLCLMLRALPMSVVPTVQTVAGNLLMIGYWGSVPYVLSWYVSGLMMALVLAPFLHACLARTARPLLMAGGLLCGCLLCGVCFAFDQRLIMVSRLPVFVLGMVFAMPRKPGEAEGSVSPSPAIPWLYALSFALGVAALYVSMARFPAALLDYGLYWYPFALIVPPLCAGLGWLLERAGAARRFLAPLRMAGQASFEIFLLDCGMEIYLKKVLNLGVSLVWLWGSMACVIAGWLYHNLTSKATQRFRKKDD